MPGSPESTNSWEATVDCHDLIEKFRDSCRSASSKSNKRSANAAPKASKAKKAKKAKKQIDSDDEDNNSDVDVDNIDNDDDDTDEKEWEVEKVVNQRKGKGGKKEYLIRWKGCKASVSKTIFLFVTLYISIK